MSGRKVEIIKQIEVLLDNGETFDNKSPQIQELRSEFITLVTKELEEQKEKFLKEGGTEGDFKVSRDELDGQFSDCMAKYNQLKKTWDDQKANELNQNLEIKRKIITDLEKLVEEEHHIGPAFIRFNELKDKWKNTGNVPSKDYKELQHDYSLQMEKFFYNINIYKTLKAYDLEKNLKLKQELIEKVKSLGAKQSIKEIRDLIGLYLKEWDEIGPTHQAKWEEVRDSFWLEVREIHKKISDHYKKLKDKYQENLKDKEQLCIDLEALVSEEISDMKGWNKGLKQLEVIQEKWKKIGFAGKTKNNQIWDRFKKMSSAFYDKRKGFQDAMKDVYKENEEKKNRLIERAEALKESVDWKNTAEAYKKLQSEWKRIGVAHPLREQKLWKKFRNSTDHFFNQRKAFFDGREDREKENLKRKREVLDKIKNVKTDDQKKAKDEIEKLGREWNAIGHVPISEKQKLNVTYDELVNKVLASAGMDKHEIEDQTYSLKVEGFKDADNATELLRNEYHHLGEKLKKIEAQVQQYENNLGFFGGNIEKNPLVKDVLKNLEFSKAEVSKLKDKMKKLNS